MIISITKRIKPAVTMAALLSSSLILSACLSSSGGGSDDVAGIGGTGIVYGRISNFGSLYVNDDRYEIDMSRIIVDGVGGQTQSALRLGMVVQLEVETENGNFTSKAIEVVYDDEVEGPFAAVPLPDPADPTVKIGTIFGQTINFSDTSTIYENTSFDDLGSEAGANMDVVEISGYRVSASEINATYVRFEGDLVPGVTEVELRGTIGMLMGSAPNQTFQLDFTTINTNASTVVDTPGGVLAENLYVEVEGIIQADSSVTASEIEFEDEDFADDVDDISLEGVISGFTNINSDFFIDSQRVNASGAVLSPPGLVLMNGMNVEVEGEIVGGTLFADEVEGNDEDSKLRSFVNNVNVPGNTFQVTYPEIPAAVTVRVDGNTTFEDDTGPITSLPFSLDDLRNGNVDFVRVEGIEIAPNEVLATFVRRTSQGSSYKLEGRVENFVVLNFVRVLGVNYPVDAMTTYDPMQPGVNDFVEIEDDIVSNVPNPPGVADEVEIEN